MLPVVCCRRGWNPHTPRLSAHFNFTLNWTSKRCIISPYQRQPAAARYAHLYLSPGFSNSPCSCRSDNLLIKPALLGSWKELVSESRWVTRCWCRRVEWWNIRPTDSPQVWKLNDRSCSPCSWCMCRPVCGTSSRNENSFIFSPSCHFRICTGFFGYKEKQFYCLGFWTGCSQEASVPSFVMGNVCRRAEAHVGVGWEHMWAFTLITAQAYFYMYNAQELCDVCVSQWFRPLSWLQCVCVRERDELSGVYLLQCKLCPSALAPAFERCFKKQT